MIDLTILSFFPEIIALFLIFFSYSWGMTARMDLPEQQNFLVQYPNYFFQALYGAGLIFSAYFFINVTPAFKGNFFQPFVHVSQMVMFVKSLIFLSGVVWLGFKLKIVRRSLQRDGASSFESIFFSSLHFLACLVLVEAQDFILVFLSLVLQHLSFILMAYREGEGDESKKNLLRHILFEIVSLFALSIALISLYVGVGSLGFAAVGKAVRSVASLGMPYHNWANLSLFMILCYMYARLRAFPFCFFQESVPRFLPKAATPHLLYQNLSVLFILSTILFQCFSSLIDAWAPMLFYGGFLSVVWASITILFQENVRKFLSSVILFYVGIVLMCFSVGNVNGLNSALFYSVLFLINASTFIYFLVNVSVNDVNISSLNQISGLGQRHPATAVILAICLLSLAAVPPFSGFWTSLYVLKELIFKGWIYVAIILLCIVLSSFQYFYVMRLLYFSKGYSELDLTENWKSTWLIVPIFLMFFFLFHKHVIKFISLVTQASWSHL